MNTTTLSDHDTITAQRGSVQALAFARKGGSALSSLLGNIATAKETERKGPLWGFVFLTDTYDEDELAAVPVIGSRQGQTGNKPYDRYSTVTKVDGADKTIQGSWLTDATRATEDYRVTQQRIDWCDDVTLEGCPADILAMGTVARRQEKDRLNTRKKDLRTGLSNTVSLYHHFKAIEELNPAKIKVRLPLRGENVLDADGKPTGETRTVVYSNIIRLEDVSKEKEDVLLNVNQFLSLKPNAIPANEEKNVTTLELTGKRAPKGQKKKGKADIAVPNTVELFLNLCNVGGTAINPDEPNGAKLNAAILEAASGKGDKADDVVETVGDFAMRVDAIWTVISARYMLIKQQKLAKLNTSAQVQAAAEAAERRAAKTA